MGSGAIVITGASSGIGAALAQALAKAGQVLVLLGRNSARLEEVAALCRSKGAQCVVQAIDMLDGAALQAFVAEFEKQHPIDLLIANAGIFPGRRWDQLTEPAEAANLVLKTNLSATVDLIYMVLPGMLARRDGRILIMASMAGLFPLVDAPAYSASKAGLISFGLALRDAVEPQGIKVVVACPGYVTTPLLAGHQGIRLGEVSIAVAVRKILRGLERNQSLIGFPRMLFWATRFYLLAPEYLRKKVSTLLRFHFS